MRIALMTALVAGCTCAGDLPPPDHDMPAAVVDSSDSAAPIDSAARDTDTATTLIDTGPLRWVAADMGASFSCGLVSDGTVRCWGVPECTSVAPGANETFTQISLGENEACGLSPIGTIRCWCCDLVSGAVTPEICEDVPTGTYEEVVVGAYYACARGAGDILRCWGWKDFVNVASKPEEPVGDFTIEDNLACAVLTDGAVECWGHYVPWGVGGAPPAGVSFEQVSHGRNHACGLDVVGNAHCWGEDSTGQPYPEPPIGAFAQIEAWRLATCVIDAAGAPTCWMSSADEQAAWDAYMPAELYAQLGLGEWGGCGVTLSGEAYCWPQDPDRITYPEYQVPPL